MASVSEMLRNLKQESGLQKTASQGGFALSPADEETVKTAEDCYAAGRIMGHGVVAGILEKLADAPVSAHGQAEPSTGDESVDKSQFKTIAEKMKRFQGHASPGSTPSVPGGNPGVVAETTAPPQTKSPNSDFKHG